MSAATSPERLEFLYGALLAAKRGFPVTVVHGLRQRGPELVCRCHRGGNCPTPGKHPIGDGWQTTASRGEATIRRLLDTYPTANIGGVIGPIDAGRRLIQLDADTSEA